MKFITSFHLSFLIRIRSWCFLAGNRVRLEVAQVWKVNLQIPLLLLFPIYGSGNSGIMIQTFFYYDGFFLASVVRAGLARWGRKGSSQDKEKNLFTYKFKKLLWKFTYKRRGLHRTTRTIFFGCHETFDDCLGIIVSYLNTPGDMLG